MRWADEKLAVLLFPNITRNFGESWQAFAYIADVETFSLPQRFLNRVLGPVAMWAAQGKIKKKYGIQDERADVNAVLHDWISSVESTTGPFTAEGPALPTSAFSA